MQVLDEVAAQTRDAAHDARIGFEFARDEIIRPRNRQRGSLKRFFAMQTRLVSAFGPFRMGPRDLRVMYKFDAVRNIGTTKRNVLFDFSICRFYK